MMKNFFSIFSVSLLVFHLAAANLCDDTSQWLLEGKSSDYSRLENVTAHGRNALRLLYDFKIQQGRDLALILKLKEPLELKEGARLSLSIYDTSSAHRFYFMCRDAGGKSALFSYTENDFRTLRHTGWKEYGFSPSVDRCDLWGGDSGTNRRLEYPVRLIAFWLDPVNRTRMQGEIFLSNLCIDGKEVKTQSSPSPRRKTAAAEELHPRLSLSGAGDGTLSWSGEKQFFHFRFQPGSRRFGICCEEIAFLDPYGNLLARRERRIDADRAYEHVVPLPEEVSGFFRLRFRLRQGNAILFEEQATGGHFTPVPQPPPEEARLGVGFWHNNPERAYAVLRRMGIRWVRTDVGWSWIEPKRGEFHWESTDRSLRAAEANGMALLVTTQYVPRWAAQQPYHQYGGNPDPAEWERFFRQLFERHGRRIAVCEVWNEPDTPYHWSGGAAAYAVHLKRAADVIRRHAPQTKIAHAGLTGEEKLWRPFSEELVQYRIGDAFDVYTFHYGQGNSVPLHRRILEQAGLGNKPLWNTESGWGSPAERIFHIVRDFAAGAEKSFYFEFQTKVPQFAQTGMMTNEFQPNPVMPLFLTFSRLLDGRVPVEQLPFAPGEMYRIAREQVIFRTPVGVTFRTGAKSLVYTDGFGRERVLTPFAGCVGVPAGEVAYLTLPENFELLPSMLEFSGDAMPVAGTSTRFVLTVRNPAARELRATVRLCGPRQWECSSAQQEIVLSPGKRCRVELELRPDLLSSETPFRCDAVLESAGNTMAQQSFSGKVCSPVESSIRSCFSAGKPGIHVTLRNLLDQPLETGVALRLPASWNCDTWRSVTLAPKSSKEFSVLLENVTTLRKERTYLIDVVLSALGASSRTEYRLNWIGIPRVENFCSWEKLPQEAELARRVNYVPDHEILETWLGPEDLSCRFRWGWSPEWIRMRWEVTDDRHVNDNTPAFAWGGDSVQVWFDGRLYDLALLRKGSSLYCHDTAADTSRIRLKIARSGTRTIYDLEFLPASGEKFRDGMNFPFSFCVNDNDGEPTRKGWMYCFARTGIGGERKNSPRVTLMAK